MPLWLPCQFLCCRVSHFLLFVCAGGCQACWNAAEVILGGRALAAALGYTWPASPPAQGLPCSQEVNQGRQQGRRGTHLVGAAGLCRGGVSNTMQDAEEDGEWGERDWERAPWPLGCYPAWGRGAETRGAFGRGKDLLCLSSCLNSSDLRAVSRLLTTAAFLFWVTVGWRCGLWLYAGVCSQEQNGCIRPQRERAWIGLVHWELWMLLQSGTWLWLLTAFVFMLFAIPSSWRYFNGGLISQRTCKAGVLGGMRHNRSTNTLVQFISAFFLHLAFPTEWKGKWHCWDFHPS